MSSRDDRTTTVEVPTRLLEAIDEEYADRGCASRSEAIRHALRSWAQSSDRLSNEIRRELQASREQRNNGETVAATDVYRRLDLDSTGRSGTADPSIEYTETAVDHLVSLNSTIAGHVVSTVEKAARQPSRLLDPIPGTAYYELRNSDWQAIVSRDDSSRFVVEAVGHRRDVYDEPTHLVGRHRSK